jgi:alanyl-tRNA synthetase
LPKSIENLVRENDELRKEMKRIAQERAKEQAADFLSDVETVGDVSVFIRTLDGVDKNGALSVFDDIKSRVNSYAVVLAAVEGDKELLLAAFSDDLVAKGFDAGAVVKQAAQVAGGGGGGKKNMAQAGAKDVAKIPEAMELARKIIFDKLNA